MSEMSDSDFFAASSPSPSVMSDADFMNMGAKQTQPSFSSDVTKDVSKELQNPNGGAFGQAMGILGDIGGEAVKRIPGVVPTAHAVSGAMQSGAQSVANAIDNPITEGAATSVGNAANDVGDYVNQTPFLKNSLDTAKRITSGMGTLSGIGDVAAGVVNYAPALAESAENASTKLPGLLGDTSSGGSAVSTAPRNLTDITAANTKLANNTNALYKKADDLGFSFTPDGGQWLSDTVRSSVEDATGGLDKQNHPGTIAALKTLDSKADDGLTLTGVDKVRQTLGRLAQNSNPDKANEVYAANKARAAIDNALSVAQNDPSLATGSPDAIDALTAARKAHALEVQHSDLRTIVRNANGNGNKIQSEFQKIHKDENGFNNLLPENQPIIQSVAQPGLGMNTAQAIGNLGFGAGGNKYALGSEAVAALLHPAAAPIVGPAVAAGTISNVVRNSLIRRAADQAMRNIESASEPIYSLYGEPKASWLPTKELPAPSVPLSLPDIANTTERPMVGGRGAQPRYVTDDEWQHLIDSDNEAKKIGLPMDVRQARQQALISQYERNNPANQAFNQLRQNQSRISPSQTALHPETSGLTPDIFDEKTGFKRGGAVQPTEAQKNAGNYKKDHINIHGLDISIETRKGEIRSGKDKNGKEWRVKLPVSYGYFKRTEGKDGDHVDCFIGPNPKSLRVYIIDQKNDAGTFDEHKCMIAFPTREAAIEAYRASYSDKKNRIMHVKKMLIPEFKEWLKNGNTKKPIKDAA